MIGGTPEPPTDPGIPLASGAQVRAHLRALLTGRARKVGVAVALVVVRALATFAPPIAVGRLVDILATDVGWSRTLPTLLALTFAVAAGAVADRARIVRVAALGEQLLAELRTQLHATVLDWRTGEVEARRGRLLSVVTSDVGALAHAVRSALPDAVEIVVLLVVAAVVLPALSPVLAGVLLAGLLPIALVGRWFAPRSTRAYADLRAAQADVVDRMQTALSALDTTRSLGITSTQDRALATTHDKLLEHELRAMRLRNILLPSVALARGLTVAAVLGVGGALALTGRLPIGSVVAFALALRVVFQPVARLSVLADLVLSSQAALARIVGVVTAQHPRLPVPSEPVPMPPAAQPRMEGVSYAYPHGGDVLHDIDLHVPAGRSLALVGPSGAGKSTILQLLARLDDPRRGRVLLDDVDVRSLDPRHLRRRVLLVTQDIALPGLTVADTVAGHFPAERRSDVCARALRTIGLDLPVNARVDDLDDARRQQVVLARVAASDPDLVLLDEATAALDPDESRAVDAALGRALSGRTLVVIAHRPATALTCDFVAVVRDGRIVDTGTPTEVAARDAWLTSFATATPAKLSRAN